jgi:hypothetical protein
MQAHTVVVFVLVAVWTETRGSYGFHCGIMASSHKIWLHVFNRYVDTEETLHPRELSVLKIIQVYESLCSGYSELTNYM